MILLSVILNRRCLCLHLLPFPSLCYCVLFL
jgi:hypothetical protein